MDIIECVDKYLKEKPQDEMIFEEIAQRADLSPAEERVLWQAISRYCDVIVNFHLKLFSRMLKDDGEDAECN